MDSIKKIKYVKDLVNKSLKDIEKFEEMEKNEDIIEENKENVKKKNNFKKKFIKSTKKYDELTKINELLIMLKDTNNLKNGIIKLNSIIDELNEKGHKLPRFEKNNMEMFFLITDMDKPEYKKKKGQRPISISLNYSLLDE